MSKAIGVIPARLHSTRIPKKILHLIEGKPMVVHVYERAKKAKFLDDVIIAIDSKETDLALKSFKVKTVMTSDKHFSGTDRIQEVVKDIEVDVIVNIQGDEPLTDPKIIDGLVDTFKDPNVHMSTVVSRKLTVSDLLNPNIVKAILDENANAVEFKRNIFELEIGGVYRHLGMYGFTRNALFQTKTNRKRRI